MSLPCTAAALSVLPLIAYMVLWPHSLREMENMKHITYAFSGHHYYAPTPTFAHELVYLWVVAF